MAIIPNLTTRSDEKRPRSGRPQANRRTLLAEGSQTYDESGTLKARPQAYVETPQHRLTDWINICGGPRKPLGRLPSDLRVGIIGGGAAGVTTAFEAVKAGAKTTMIEARSEVGGRARSVEVGSKNIFEEVSMRFPPSEAALYLLAETFGFGFINHFPDPGVVPTLICYEGKSQLWTDLSTPPEGFETVTAGWKALVDGGCVVNGKESASAKKMAEWLRNPHKEIRMQVVQKWQDYINEFKNDTFLHALKKIFSPTNDTPPAGKHWTDGDVDRFGKLGVGSGGFGAFFNAGFLTILRFVVNSWDTNQATFAKLADGKPEAAGIRDLWHRIWECWEIRM